MSWILLVGVSGVLGMAMCLVAIRRAELTRMHRAVASRERGRREGTDEAQLQYPLIDLSRCLGCATCVAVCPEGDVLDIVHGQAVVVNGSRCEGVSACERECPAGAITVTLANVETRADVPVLTSKLEAQGSPGLFLAGEVTAHALIARAVEHGTRVAAEVAKRVKEGVTQPDALDLVIVGAGPAGLACALEAKRNGLRFLVADQAARPGGTVAKYPRRKLVMSRPLELPLYGRSRETTYTKEELCSLWQRIVFEQGLDFRGGQVFRGLQRHGDGCFTIETSIESFRARHVCLAIGRRGVPRMLGVPGEGLPKVNYSLIDAGSFTNRRVLVVGGGNSAIETALGLAEQPGNVVALSCRRPRFFRLEERNRERLEAATRAGRIDVYFNSRVRDIRNDEVELQVVDGEKVRSVVLPNEEVFVQAGGVPSFELLQDSGVSFDPTQRPRVDPPEECGIDVGRGLLFGLVFTLAALGFYFWHSDYYFLSPGERAMHPKHDFLCPGRGIGLYLGIGAAGLVGVNLLYLWRRSPRRGFAFGTLSAWMTSHIATGVLAFSFVALHGAMGPRNTLGGYAFWALVVLLVTGAIGRYLYAWVPRATDGHELNLEELKAHFGGRLDARPAQRGFHEKARTEVLSLIGDAPWNGSFFSRLGALWGVRRDLSRVLAGIEKRGRTLGMPAEEVSETLRYSRYTHRQALLVAHFEDVRSLLSSWRCFVRWIAVLMMLLMVLHIVYALNSGMFPDIFNTPSIPSTGSVPAVVGGP